MQMAQGGELMQKDPICGMMVDEKKTKLTSTHDSKTFYFCSADCKATFDKDAHKHGHV
jgi:Cu+-exporting ATPase